MIDGDILVGGYLTGPKQPVFVTMLDIGAVTTVHQDQLGPHGGNLRFGRDHQSPAIWKLSFCIGEGYGAEEALDALADVEEAWINAVDFTVPGATTTLTYAAAGRVRRVYGRPRNFTPSVTENMEDGHVIATAEFVLQGTGTFDEVEQRVELTHVPGNAGGLVSPLVSPLRTVAGGTRQGQAVIGGRAPAPVTVEFFGPSSNPSIHAGEWEIGLRGVLAYDQSVVVDSRAGTVLRNDGASMGGYLTRDTYLADAVLKPGHREISYSAADPTGTSRAVVSWRPAYYSY